MLPECRHLQVLYTQLSLPISISPPFGENYAMLHEKSFFSYPPPMGKTPIVATWHMRGGLEGSEGVPLMRASLSDHLLFWEN